MTASRTSIYPLFGRFAFCRGYIGVDHMTVSRGCTLYLGLTGTTELANKESTYKFHSLNVNDGGQVTSTSDVKNSTLTLDIDDVTIHGGGTLRMTRMLIEAGNFTVDDLGEVRGDLHQAK